MNTPYPYCLFNTERSLLTTIFHIPSAISLKQVYDLRFFFILHPSFFFTPPAVFSVLVPGCPSNAGGPTSIVPEYGE